MLTATKVDQERLKASQHGLMSIASVRRGSALLAFSLALLLALLAVACGGEGGSGTEMGASDLGGKTSPSTSNTIRTYRSPT